jgi:hypothetical protein
MTPRVFPPALLVLIIALLALPATANEIFSGRIDADDYLWTRGADGAYRLEFKHGRPLNVTDQPDLPARDLLLAIPADWHVVDVRVEPLRVRTEALPGRLQRADPLLASDDGTRRVEDLQPADGVFPATWGRFGGVQTWRGYRLLSVNLHPFRVREGADGGRLEVLESYAVHAVLGSEAGSEPPLGRERLLPGEGEAVARELAAIVDNPERLDVARPAVGQEMSKTGAPFQPAPMPDVDGSEVSYLVLTTEALAGEFQRLADHRTRQGLPATVVTLEWVQANQRQGADLAETIRYFLQDAYAKWGLEYLLIGGDTDVVPTRTVRSTFYPYGGHTDIPTDLYYGALDGTWAGDGDGWYAEPYVSATNPGDLADMAPEIAVGRAPVRDALGARQFVDKVIAYETAAAGSDWPNRMLYAAEVLFPSDYETNDPITLDGASFAEVLIQEYQIPCTDMEYVRMYESWADTNVSYPPGPVPLTRAALIDSLNTGHYGQVSQFGHGHFFNMSVGDANFTVADAAALTNDNSFLLFAINCASGAFDVSCLLERFVQNPHGGAIMSVGAAREAFPSSSFAYQEYTYDGMWCGGNPNLVRSLNAARLAYIGNTQRNTVDRWTQLNVVVIGDPALQIWDRAPMAPAIAAPTQLSTGEQSLAINVTAGGAPVEGALVCARKDGETYAYGTTDAGGDVQLIVIPASEGTLELTVSGQGVARTSTSIPVAGSEAYLSLTGWTVDDSSGNGNGNAVAEAGELVELTLAFEDLGGGGATGLTATVSSTHPDINVFVGTVALDDCAPGGTTTATEAVVAVLQSSCPDGTSIPLRVTVNDDQAREWVSNATLEVVAPEPRIVRLEIDDQTHGDGDGVVEDGERIVLTPVIKNFGGGRLDRMTVDLVDAVDGVTVYAGSVVLDAAGPLQETSILTGEISLALADALVASPARLVLTDNYGRVFDQDLEFQTVIPPTLPTLDATQAEDTIVLRWAPVTDEIIGYNVYRATEPGGEYVKANTDLIEGVAYFADRGLDQLTEYWYKITAVDRHLMESAASPATMQSTMPPELENFPLPFAVQTSGHPAVGDLDGDGDLEIVLGSDELYVWHHDGNELLDGDGDGQSNGPFTGLSGEFGPAGITLAEIDGEPGLEIIASERVTQARIIIYKEDGSILPGWPRNLRSSWNWATPTVGDVDGDGDPEIIVHDLAGRIFVWHHDGQELRDGDDNPATDGVFLDRPGSWPLSSPALLDVDGDGKRDIIWGTKVWDGTNKLLAYRYDGTEARGFPYETGSGVIQCSPAVADLDRDGEMEIIFFTLNNQLIVLRSNGQLYPGFPVQHSAPWDDSAGPSPAVGNFDADDHYEIVWPVNAGTTRMDLLIVDTDVAGGTSGDILPGWPVQLPANSEGSPVVGDLNGDGLADIVQPIGSDETDTPDLITAFDAAGQPLAGFPIALGGHCRSTPVICDLEGDGDVDLVYGSWDLELHVWDLPGAYDADLVPWATFQGNMQRDGVLSTVSVVGVPEAEELPEAFTVLPPYPNPFNPTTTLRLYVAPGSDQRLDLAVFDLRGRLVRQLHSGRAEAGWREFTWDGRDDGGRGQASGVYFVRARQAHDAETFKLTLVK